MEICLEYRTQPLPPNSTSYLNSFCAQPYLSVTYQDVSFLPFHLMCRLSKMGSENKRRRTTWVPAKRAAGWGAKALAHIIFLFRAVIKQSACHCSKVNRLTFKYTMVSGAPSALRDASSLQEKTDQHLHICFWNPFAPLQFPGSLYCAVFFPPNH